MIPTIRKVFVRNYKSLGQVSVDLRPMTVLVGPNGAGKSNFIEALAFVQECLADSIELAFKSRGGIGAVRRRSGGHPTHIGIRLILDLTGGVRGEYSFEIAAKPKERFRVSRERCVLVRPMHAESEVAFEVRDGRFKQPIPGIRPQVSPDRLALFAASATEEFRPIYDFLTAMRFYSIVPRRVGGLQDPDPGEFLKPDGGNAAAVLKSLEEKSPAGYERLSNLLEQAIAGVRKVEPIIVGQKETLRFRQDIGLKNPWAFEALSMSDGTLRLLGLLLAVYQPGSSSLIAIEEPEATVHPAIAELVLQVLRDATREHQVLVTTHSPDILDSKELHHGEIRVVTKEGGGTVISTLDAASRQAIRERLYTPGELLRDDELGPDTETARREAEQMKLFGPALPGEAEEHATDDRPHR